MPIPSLTYLREQDPRFNDVPDDQLVRFIGATYPDQLGKDQDLASRHYELTGGETFSSEERAATEAEFKNTIPFTNAEGRTSRLRPADARAAAIKAETERAAQGEATAAERAASQGPAEPAGIPKAVATVTRTAGNVAVGAATDIGRGDSSFPLLNAALRGAQVGVAGPDSPLPARIAEGAVRGAGEMAPALAVTAAGVPVPVAFGAQMGLSTLGEGGTAGEAALSGLTGALLPAAGSFGKGAASRLVSRLVAEGAVVPPAVAKTVETVGAQAGMNLFAVAMQSPEFIRLYKENPEKAVDHAAEFIGVNLLMGAHDIIGIARPSVKSPGFEAGVQEFKAREDVRQTIDKAARELIGVTPEQIAEKGKNATTTRSEEPRTQRRETDAGVQPVGEDRNNFTDLIPSRDENSQRDRVPVVEGVQAPQVETPPGPPIAQGTPPTKAPLAVRILTVRGVAPDVAEFVAARAGDKPANETSEDYRARVNGLHDEFGFKVPTESVKYGEGVIAAARASNEDPARIAEAERLNREGVAAAHTDNSALIGKIQEARQSGRSKAAPEIATPAAPPIETKPPEPIISPTEIKGDVTTVEEPPAPVAKPGTEGPPPPKKPTTVSAPPTDWDSYYENLVVNLDSFSPARDTGKRNYAMDDVAQRFVDFAKADKSGKAPSELVKDFAKTDEATTAQIKKLRTSVKDLETKAPIAEPISPPTAPASSPPVADVTAPSATRTPEAGAVETPAKATAKVQDEVESVASTEGARPAKDIKAELVERLTKAVADAPNESDVSEKTATLANGKRYVSQLDTRTKVTIDIPGDGVFTVWNTKEALSEVLKRAKKISVSTTPPKGYTERGISAEDKAWVKEQMAAQPAPKLDPLAAVGEEVEIRNGDKVIKLPKSGKMSDLQGLEFNEVQSEVAAAIFPMVKDVPFRFIDDPNLPAASYNGSDGVLLNGPKLANKPNFTLRAIIHEAVHAASYLAIRDPAKAAEVGRLKELMALANQKWGFTAKGEMTSGERLRFDHAFKNVDEFVAATITDAKFQEFLGQIKATDRNKITGETKGFFGTLLKRTWDAIAKLVGVRDGTVLSEALSLSENLLTGERMQRPLSESAALRAAEPERASIDDVEAQEQAATAQETKIRESKPFKANAELADDIGKILPAEGESGVPTKVGDVHDMVMSRPGLNAAVREDSVAHAESALTEAGLNFKRADDGLFTLADDVTPQEEGGRKLVDILKREILTAKSEGRGERIANLLNTIAFHLGRDANKAFSQQTKNSLYALAQGTRSEWGRNLGSLAMWGKLLAHVAQNPSLHLNRIYFESLGGKEITEVMEKIEKAADGALTPEQRTDAKDPEKRPALEGTKEKPGPVRQAREKALKDIWAELAPEERKVFAKGKPLWQKIENAVRNGIFDPGPILEEMARKKGWTVPTEDQKKQIKDWAEKEMRLRTPTQRQIDNAGGDIAKATLQAEKGTLSERLKLLKDMQANWSRWSMPTSWNPRNWLNPEIAKNNAKAVDEFVAANLLFKFGFVSRQFIDVGLVSMPLNAVNRTLVHVLERAQNDGGFSAETLADLGSASKEMLVARIASMKATKRAMERTATGQVDRKVLDRMTNSIGVFERMRVKADELEATGTTKGKLEARAIRLATVLQAGYRVAATFDTIQSLGLEWQEMRQQLSTDLRAAGKNRAEIAMNLDEVFGGMKVNMLQAEAEVRAIKSERGLELDEKAVESDAWELIKARSYDEMRRVAGTNTPYELENEQLRELHSWNLPETGGIGGGITKVINTAKGYAQQHGIPTGGILSFGNAMGIAANRMATFSGLGLFGGWGFGSSPWYEGARNIRQRRIEAIQGLTIIGSVIALAAAGKILVQTKYPKDKDEKERFLAEGHKLGTVKFMSDDGKSWVEYPIQMSPFSFIASHLYMIGGVQRLLADQHAAQEKLNAEAAKTGVTPGKAKAIGTGDLAGIIAQGIYGLFTGGRTASGAIQSFSDYGDFNINKAAAGVIGPYIPGVPGWQEVARMMGAAMDTKTATVMELLVPTPGSGHQRVNSLGDPLVNPNDGMRILQVLTGGIGFGSGSGNLPDNHAYQQVFNAGFSAPDVSRNKGFNFDGTIRPMTPQELEKYTVARGKAFKQELAGVETDGLSETDSKKLVREAFQRANSSALQEIGVTVAEKKETSASGRAASGAGASGGAAQSGRTVGIPRTGEARSATAGGLRQGGIRRGRLSRGFAGARRGLSRASRIRSQPRIGRGRRSRGLSRVRR